MVKILLVITAALAMFFNLQSASAASAWLGHQARSPDRMIEVTSGKKWFRVFLSVEDRMKVLSVVYQYRDSLSMATPVEVAASGKFSRATAVLDLETKDRVILEFNGDFTGVMAYVNNRPSDSTKLLDVNYRRAY